VTEQRIQAIALDFGGTISPGTAGHLIAQKPVDPSAAALRVLAEDPSLTLILAPSTLPCETRWPALREGR
jgi:hypothetical protein